MIDQLLIRPKAGWCDIILACKISVWPCSLLATRSLLLDLRQLDGGKTRCTRWSRWRSSWPNWTCSCKNMSSCGPTGPALEDWKCLCNRHQSTSVIRQSGGSDALEWCLLGFTEKPDRVERVRFCPQQHGDKVTCWMIRTGVPQGVRECRVPRLATYLSAFTADTGFIYWFIYSDLSKIWRFSLRSRLLNCLISLLACLHMTRHGLSMPWSSDRSSVIYLTSLHL